MANDFSGSTEDRKFVGQFGDYQLSKKVRCMMSVIESRLRVALRSLQTASRVSETTVSYLILLFYVLCVTCNLTNGDQPFGRIYCVCLQV
jgi:hypothetical protein